MANTDTTTQAPPDDVAPPFDPGKPSVDWSPPAAASAANDAAPPFDPSKPSTDWSPPVAAKTGSSPTLSSALNGTLAGASQAGQDAVNATKNIANIPAATVAGMQDTGQKLTSNIMDAAKSAASGMVEDLNPESASNKAAGPIGRVGNAGAGILNAGKVALSPITGLTKTAADEISGPMAGIIKSAGEWLTQQVFPDSKVPLPTQQAIQQNIQPDVTTALGAAIPVKGAGLTGGLGAAREIPTAPIPGQKALPPPTEKPFDMGAPSPSTPPPVSPSPPPDGSVLPDAPKLTTPRVDARGKTVSPDLLPPSTPHDLDLEKSPTTGEWTLPNNAPVGAATISPLEGLDPQAIQDASKALKEVFATPHMLEQGLEEQSAHHMAGELGGTNGAPSRSMNGILGNPGQGAQDIAGAFVQRQSNAEAGERLSNILDQGLGAKDDLATIKRAERINQLKSSDPLYKRFESLQIQPTPEIKKLLTSPDGGETPAPLVAAGVFGKAKQFAALQGIPWKQNFFTTGAQKAFPTAQSWQLIKEALDSQIQDSYNNFGQATKRTALLQGIRNDLVDALDNHPNVGNIWKEARENYASFSGLKTARDLGDRLLTERVDPNELRYLTANFSEPQMAALRQQVRYNIAKESGRAGAKPWKIVNKLLAENNQDKLSQVINDDAVSNRFNQALVHEQEMTDSKNSLNLARVGSQTQRNLADAAARAKSNTLASKIGTVAKTGAQFLHAPFRTTGSLAFEHVGGMLEKSEQLRQDKINADLSKIWTMQNPEARAILPWIYEHGETYTGTPNLKVVPRAAGGNVTYMRSPRSVPNKAGGGGTDAATVDPDAPPAAAPQVDPDVQAAGYDPYSISGPPLNSDAGASAPTTAPAPEQPPTDTDAPKQVFKPTFGGLLGPGEVGGLIGQGERALYHIGTDDMYSDAVQGAKDIGHAFSSPENFQQAEENIGHTLKSAIYDPAVNYLDTANRVMSGQATPEEMRNFAAATATQMVFGGIAPEAEVADAAATAGETLGSGMVRKPPSKAKPVEAAPEVDELSTKPPVTVAAPDALAAFKNATGRDHGTSPTDLTLLGRGDISLPPHMTIDDFNAEVQRKADDVKMFSTPQRRYWYENSGKAILNAVGGDPEMADRLTAAVAKTSQSTPVLSNAAYSARAHSQAMVGDPIHAGLYPNVMGKHLTDYYGETQPNVVGPKITGYQSGFRTAWNPEMLNEGANDIWNMRWLGYKKGAGQPPPRVQAADGTWARAPEKDRGIGDNGGPPLEEDEGPGWKGTPTTGQHNYDRLLRSAVTDRLNAEGFDGGNWQPGQVQAVGWAKQRADSGLSPAEDSFDISNAFNARSARLTYESVPGKTTNHLPEYHDAAPEVKQAYHDAINKVLTDPSGRDIIASHMGLLTQPTEHGMGFYQGAASPGSAARVVTGDAPGGWKSGIDSATKELMAGAEYTRGLLLQQDAVASHLPRFPKSGLTAKNANLVDVRTGSAMTENEARTISQHMEKETGTDFFSPIFTKEGYRFINVPEVSGLTNPKFHQAVDRAIDKTYPNKPEGSIDTVRGASPDSFYETNDWSKQGHGQSFLEGLRSLRPDVQRRSAELLATLGPKISETQDAFADAHGWTPNPSTRIWDTNPAFKKYQDVLSDITPGVPPKPWEPNTRPSQPELLQPGAENAKPSVDQTQGAEPAVPLRAAAKNVTLGSGQTSGEVAPRFFSAVEQAINNAKTDKAPVATWLGMLRSNPAVKQSEIDWLGLEDWLKEKNGGVSVPNTARQALADWKAARDPASKQGPPTDLVKNANAENAAAQKAKGEAARTPVDKQDILGYVRGNTPNVQEVEKGGDTYQKTLTGFKTVSNTKYGPDSGYNVTLPGGKNYRETLLTLPPKVKTSDWSIRDNPNVEGEYEVVNDKGRVMYGTTDKDDAQKYITDQNQIDAKSGAFQSTHWEEPNVLAHVRHDDRVLNQPSDEKIRDIAQRMKDAVGVKNPADMGSGAPDLAVKKGAVTPEEAAEFSRAARWQNQWSDKPGLSEKDLHLAEIQSDWAQKGAKEGYKEAPTSPEGWTVTNSNVSGRVVKDKDGTTIASFDEPVSKFSDKDLINDAWNTYGNRYQKNAGVPDMPFKTNWHELALKRMIRYAAENGYDRLSWDTGKTNADRYNLSEVGGAFHKRLYDQKLPDAANKIGNKYGAKVEDVQIPTPRTQEGLMTQEEWDDVKNKPSTSSTTAHSIKITPELRDAALQHGMSLFSGTSKPGVALATADARATQSSNQLAHGFMLRDENVEARKLGYDIPKGTPDRWSFSGPGIASRTYNSRDAALADANKEIAYHEANLPGAPPDENPNPQIKTPQFKNWFGNSQVVDKNGDALRAYHGTTKDFTTFNTKPDDDKVRANPSWFGGLGSWFAAPSKHHVNYDEGNAEDVAGSFAESNKGFKPGARVIPAYLKIEKPKEYDDHDELFSAVQKAGGPAQLRAKLEKSGSDGIVIRNSDTDGNTDRDDWIAFHPTQIKSATGNSGAFDPNDAAIHKARGGAAHEKVLQRAAGGRVVAKDINHKPSGAQKAAENYKKEHVRIQGLDIAIETAKGFARSGVGKDGKAWSVKMPAHYGYLKRTEGADGDHVDVYLGPHIKSPKVFIIDQLDAGTKAYDEHKVMLGFGTKQQATNIYKSGFSDGKGKDRIGAVHEMSIDAFKEWLKHGDTTKPLSGAISTKSGKLTRQVFQYTPKASSKDQCKICHFTSGNVSSVQGCGLYRMLNQRCPDDFDLNPNIDAEGWCAGWRSRK